MKWIIIVVTIAFGGGLLYLGGDSFFGSGMPAAQAIATVNRDNISDFELHQAHMAYVNFSLQMGQPVSRLQEDELRFSALQELIDEKLILQAASRERIRANERDVNEEIDNIKASLGNEYGNVLRSQGLNEKTLKDMIRQGYTIQAVIEAKSAVELTDEEVRQAYEDQYERRAVRHILFEAQLVDGERQYEPALERAEEMLGVLRDGGDFASLAEEHSDDSITAIEGGYVGLVSRNHPFVPEFLEAVFSLPVGQISEPVRTPYGYHLIEVTEVTMQAAPEGETFEEAEEAFRQRLQAQRGNEVFSAWLAEQRENADIVILDPELSAFQLARTGQYDQAIARYQDALTERPGDPYLMYRLGRTLEMVGATDEAIAMYQDAADHALTDPVLWFVLGTAYMDTSQYEAARDALVKASDYSQGDPQIRLVLAEMYDEMGFTELADAEREAYDELQAHMLEQFMLQQEGLQSQLDASDGATQLDGFSELERALEEQIRSTPESDTTADEGLGEEE